MPPCCQTSATPEPAERSPAPSREPLQLCLLDREAGRWRSSRPRSRAAGTGSTDRRASSAVRARSRAPALPGRLQHLDRLVGDCHSVHVTDVARVGALRVPRHERAVEPDRRVVAPRDVGRILEEARARRAPSAAWRRGRRPRRARARGRQVACAWVAIRAFDEAARAPSRPRPSASLPVPARRRPSRA